MLDSWLPFLIYGIFAAAIPATMVAMSFLLATRPAARTRARGVPFESGVSAGPLPEQRFTVSFYLTAMLFIVFDIEIVFLYPLAVVLDELALVRLRRAHRLHRDPRARLRLRLAEGGARVAVNGKPLRDYGLKSERVLWKGKGPGVFEQEVAALEERLMLTTLERAVAWAQSKSMWPDTFGLACCAIEMMSIVSSRYDIARFGMEAFRASPRQADLLIVSGRVVHKMAEPLRQIYDQMLEPKWVIAMGACASSGGMFNNYTTLQGVDKIVPVDVHVPGCPPRPEALMEGIVQAAREGAGRRAARVRDPRGRRVMYEGVPGVVETKEAHGETTLVVDPARLSRPASTCATARLQLPLRPLVRRLPRLGRGARRRLLGERDRAATSTRPGTAALPRTPEPKPKRFAVNYHLLRVAPGAGDARRVRVQIWLDDGEAAPSVIRVWPTADWHEREVWDMMGIRFEGHPNLVRILMEDDWEGHPLRKDYPIGGEPVRFSDEV